MIIGLHHVHVNCQDVEVTAKYFKDVFAANEVQRGKLGGQAFIRMDLKGLVINLQGTEPGSEQLDPGKGKRGLDHFCLRVDDVSREVESMQGKGVKILREPFTSSTGNQVAFVGGPDGIRIELLQKK